MTRTGCKQIAYAVLLAMLLTASAWLVRLSDQARGDESLQEVLYLPSPRVAQRMSLGYSGLLADIYWTRVVQYFGTKHQARSMQYKLLAPLLETATELDPQLLPAYEFGSIFLAQRPPEGAGDPQAAARLVEKGIAHNPAAWRLYYDLGYIDWLELHDPSKAADAFARGANLAGAKPWMRVMAAALAAHAGETETAVYMWTNILNSTNDAALRANATQRLLSLRVDREVELLQQRVDLYTQQRGSLPAGWSDLIASGLLRGIPSDPKGRAYRLNGGRVQVAVPSNFPFLTRGLPPGYAPSDLATEPGFHQVQKKFAQQ